MKKIVALFLSTIFVVTTMLPLAAEAKQRAYYSGDAIEFNGSLITASTNMGKAEIFTVANKKMTLVSTFGFNGENKTGKDGFYDVALKIEGQKLFAYLVDGPWMYKYEITNPAKPVLTSKIQDNSYDWFLGVRSLNDGVMTIGTKGIKFYDKNLVVVDTAEQSNKHQYSIQVDPVAKYIVNTNEDKLSVTNRLSRQKLFETKLISKESHGRKVAIVSQGIFLADDSAITFYGFDGKIGKSVVHGEKFGYDIAVSADGKYIYATVGAKVMKLDAKTLKTIKKVDTTNFGAKEGWSMGLKVVGNKVVVFNNTSVMVMNENLQFQTGFKASVEAIRPWMQVSVSLSSGNAPSGSPIMVTGKGFGYNETVVVDFAGQKTTLKTDNEGSISGLIYVPTAKSGVQLINFSGQLSQVDYQVSFNIK